MRPTALLAALVLLAAAAPAAAEITTVQINHSQRLSLSGSAAQVFVGNAEIADVAVVNHNTLMLTGKKYGLTNLQVVDAGGRTILNREIQVAGDSQGMVTFYRGSVGKAYTCSPDCQEAPGAAAADPAGAAAPAAPSVTP